MDIAEFVTLLSTNPAKAYEKIKAGVYRKLWFLKFNQEWSKHGAQVVGFDKLYGKIQTIAIIQEIRSRLLEVSKNQDDEITRSGVSSTQLLRYLYLILELGQLNKEYYNSSDLVEFRFNELEYTIDYNLRSLKAVSNIYKMLHKKLARKTSKTDNTSEAIKHIRSLLYSEYDRLLAEELVDGLLWGNLIPIIQDNELKISPEGDQANNFYVLNKLKNQVLKYQYGLDMRDHVSSESHFKKIDPQFNTDQGFPGIFVSEGIDITDKPEGIAVIEQPEDFFEKYSKDGMSIRDGSDEMFFKIFNKAKFYYYYRQRLTSIFKPTEGFNIKSIQIDVGLTQPVAIHTIFLVFSCLAAFADSLHDFWYTDRLGLPSIKSNAPSFGFEELKGLDAKGRIKAIDFTISNMIGDEKYQALFEPIFFRFTEESLVKLLHTIEDLKGISHKKLSSIVRYFSEVEPVSHFKILHFPENICYFPYRIFRQFDIGRVLFDFCLRNKLFSVIKQYVLEKINLDFSESHA
ncbi:MAG: hypothetical protein IH946_10625 [Bacteroidetes bacterium]|nr:hypothetical protein [Bacteroidota bacterium]